jgi:hypothetical protein
MWKIFLQGHILSTAEDAKKESHHKSSRRQRHEAALLYGHLREAIYLQCTSYFFLSMVLDSLTSPTHRKQQYQQRTLHVLIWEFSRLWFSLCLWVRSVVVCASGNFYIHLELLLLLISHSGNSFQCVVRTRKWNGLVGFFFCQDGNFSSWKEQISRASEGKILKN